MSRSRRTGVIVAAIAVSALGVTGVANARSSGEHHANHNHDLNHDHSRFQGDGRPIETLLHALGLY